MLRNKHDNGILRFTIGVIVGSVVTVLPVTVYLIKTDALKSCLVFSYLTPLDFYAISPLKRAENLYKMFKDLNANGGFLLLCITMITGSSLLAAHKIKETKYKLLLIALILSIGLNTLVNALTGVYHPHYFISFIPLLLFPSIILFEVIYRFLKHLADKTSLPSYLPKILMLSILLCLSTSNIEANTQIIFDHINAQNSATQRQIDFILSNTSKEDEIQLFGGYCPTILFQAQRESASRFFYQPFWNAFQKEFIDDATVEILNDIYNKKPKVILLSEKEQDRFYKTKFRHNMTDFMHQYYTEKATIETIHCYVRK